MSTDKREPGAMAHTPLMDVPIKSEVRSAVRLLPLAPDRRDHNAGATFQNIIIRRTEYNKLKDRNRELEEQYRGISTSYSVLHQDVKEVDAKNRDLEKRIKELEAQLEAKHQDGLEHERRELFLKGSMIGCKVYCRR